MTTNLIVLNPNTTVSMTDKMVVAANGVVANGTNVRGVTSHHGAVSIEGYFDEAFAVPGVIDAIRKESNCDGFVIGCFDDTGVDAARCITDVPVVGLCQAAMQAAAVVAGSFSVVTTLNRSVPALEHLAERYGYGRLCRRVRASEVAVLELEAQSDLALDKIRAEIDAALRADRAEAIVLGCAGMADLAHQFSVEFGIPVVEGVTAAVKLLEGLAALGLQTSRIGGYAQPNPKRYDGMFTPFAPDPS